MYTYGNVSNKMNILKSSPVSRSPLPRSRALFLRLSLSIAISFSFFFFFFFSYYFSSTNIFHASKNVPVNINELKLYIYSSSLQSVKFKIQTSKYQTSSAGLAERSELVYISVSPFLRFPLYIFFSSPSL